MIGYIEPILDESSENDSDTTTYGDCEFEDQVYGGTVPSEYIPSVDNAFQELNKEGILIGQPIVNVRMALTDGNYHEVDSSDLAFRIATTMAYKQGTSRRDAGAFI